MIIGYLDGEIIVYQSLDEVMREWGKYPADVLAEEIIFSTKTELG